MAEETVEEKLARLETENESFKVQAQLEKLGRLKAENELMKQQIKTGELRLKVSEKGGLSVYGLGRFPVTLYKEQWTRLLAHAEEIREFLKTNDEQLKAKQ